MQKAIAEANGLSVAADFYRGICRNEEKSQELSRLDHSFKQEQAKASGFVQLIVGGIERIAGSLTVSDSAIPATDISADPQYVQC